MKKELTENRPHFDVLRSEASSKAKGLDYLAIIIGGQTWLFPVSQKHLRELYSLCKLGGKMEVIPFSYAVGFAPQGMPFTHTDEHWKELRKNVAAIFHNDFMNAYLVNFNTAVKELAEKWKDGSGGIFNIAKDIGEMAYNAAVFSLIGSKLDVEVPYDDNGTVSNLHIRDVNAKTLRDFAKHAASNEFVEDKDYRLSGSTAEATSLNKNMETLAGALTGLVNARVTEIQDGAESKTTIVDAAISLTLKGIIKDVGEAVQHGWAILNGAHIICANTLSAALFYLLKNPDKYEILKEEINTQLIKGETFDESNLYEILDRDHIKELDYLTQVVKETLRLSSPIYGKPMRAKEDIELEDGLVIKEDTIVYPNNGVIGVSENIWKEPLKFIPERFDKNNEYSKLPDGDDRENISFLAFGGGQRACMGDNYSQYFVKVALVYFIHLFEFDITEEPKIDSFFYWLNERQYSAKVTIK